MVGARLDPLILSPEELFIAVTAYLPVGAQDGVRLCDPGQAHAHTLPPLLHHSVAVHTFPNLLLQVLFGLVLPILLLVLLALVFSLRNSWYASLGHH